MNGARGRHSRYHILFTLRVLRSQFRILLAALVRQDWPGGVVWALVRTGLTLALPLTLVLFRPTVILFLQENIAYFSPFLSPALRLYCAPQTYQFFSLLI